MELEFVKLKLHGKLKYRKKWWIFNYFTNSNKSIHSLSNSDIQPFWRHCTTMRIMLMWKYPIPTLISGWRPIYYPLALSASNSISR